ncbi:MAG: hypothetical protein AABO41_27060 [Acidobacteriota bacterium]
MNICGYGLRDHIKLLGPMFGLIAVVWLLRWVLWEATEHHRSVLVLSVTALTSLSILVAVGLMHFRRFGSYLNVVVASFLLVTWGQLLIVAAILFAVVSGIENVYTAPEFSQGRSHGENILGHLTFLIGAGTLLGSATGCLLLWLLRKLAPARTSQDSAR